MTETEETILISVTGAQVKRAATWAAVFLSAFTTVFGGSGFVLWDNARESRYLRDSVSRALFLARQDSALTTLRASDAAITARLDSILAAVR